MEYRRGRITQEYRRRGRPARLARFRRFRSGLGATHVTHDDDNLRAASTSTSAAFASSERSMRWTNSWGRGLNRSAGRAPGHCVLRWGQDVPSFPHAPFLAPALFLRCASDSFSLTKPNTSCIEWPASLRSEVFGFIPECRSASLRKQRSASPESSFSTQLP